MSWRSVLVAGVLAAVVALAVAGCGGDESDSDDGSKAADTVPDAQAEQDAGAPAPEEDSGEVSDDSDEGGNGEAEAMRTLRSYYADGASAAQICKLLTPGARKRVEERGPCLDSVGRAALGIPAGTEIDAAYFAPGEYLGAKGAVWAFEWPHEPSGNTVAMIVERQPDGRWLVDQDRIAP